MTPPLFTRGMTLIELMIAIAIVLITSQISMSFLPDLLARNRIDNKINLLYRYINSARLYAIEKQTYVSICALKNNQCVEGEWHNQLSLFIDPNKSASMDSDDVLLSTFNSIPITDTLQYPRIAITFQPDGSLNGLQNGTFTYCSNRSNIEGRALSVSQVGRIRIKSTTQCQTP